MGQLFASRTRMLPKEFTDELKKLQDEVEPVTFDEVSKVLEKELHEPVESVFQSIERKPLGSASIAQVHQALLRTAFVGGGDQDSLGVPIDLLPVQAQELHGARTQAEVV